MKAQVLYFDYWTRGVNNFKSIDRKIKESGFQTKLIHLGSWRDISCPKYQAIDGIDCYDIRYYKTNFFHNILKLEKPVVVIILNASFIMDRSVILSCKQLGIKCVYLMHGSLTREDFIEDSIKVMNKTKKRGRLKNSFKQIRPVLNYLYSTFMYNKRYILKCSTYKALLKTFSDPGTYLHFPPPSFDLTPDLTLTYGIGEKMYYEKRFTGYKSRVEVIGNPGLDMFFLEIDKLGKDKNAFYNKYKLPFDKSYVVYIEEGLVEDNIWDNIHRINFFTEINSACRIAGLHLVIKLHPRTAGGPNRDSFNTIVGATILSDINFPKLIYFSDKCIGHYSTTFIYPMLLNKPILVPKWGESAKILSIYSKKEATEVYSLKELSTYLQQQNFNYNRNEYINNNIPYRDGKTSERIVNHILEIL